MRSQTRPNSRVSQYITLTIVAYPYVRQLKMGAEKHLHESIFEHRRARTHTWRSCQPRYVWFSLELPLNYDAVWFHALSSPWDSLVKIWELAPLPHLHTLMLHPAYPMPFTAAPAPNISSTSKLAAAPTTHASLVPVAAMAKASRWLPHQGASDHTLCTYVRDAHAATDLGDQAHLGLSSRAGQE